MSIHPTAEWSQLDDRNYRKREVYNMLWEGMDLSRNVVVGAPFGGPLAITRDEKKLQVVNSGALRPAIQFYSSAGKPISSFPWSRGKIIGMGWTDHELFVTVLEDGTVIVYSIQGESIAEFSMGKECKEKGIIDCKIWGNGIAVLTRNFQFYVVGNLQFANSYGMNNPPPASSVGASFGSYVMVGEARPKRLADARLNESPPSWEVIPAEFTLSLNIEILVATSTGTILSVDSSGVQDMLLSNGPFTKMRVSPNGKLVACFNENGVLTVMTTDFSKNLSQFNTESKVPPDQMEWCGVDSVLLYWDQLHLLLMIGPFSEYLKWTYDSSIYLAPEVDGVRIISSDTCEFLSRVPTVTEEIFKIGSTAPAAMLFDALDHFEKKNPKADENIRSIKSGNELQEAVNACIQAAVHETAGAHSINLQKTLLRAASFGKCFLDRYDASTFVNMSKVLRILNAVSHYEIGIPLTYPQYRLLGPQGLIDRLINRHEHLLALRISDYLKLRKDKVLVHWACTKIKSQSTSVMPENELGHLIVSKLQQEMEQNENVSVSFAEIASTAYKAKKYQLATYLLDYEPKAADQVPLLLSMHEDALALEKAIDSGDTDLVYLVVLHLRKTIPKASEFFRIIHDKPVALNLLIVYARQQQDTALLKDIYKQLDQPVELANILLQEAVNNSDLDKRAHEMQEAMTLYQQSVKDPFVSKATEEEIKLLLVQRDLESTIGGSFVDLSLSETLYRLITLGEKPAKRAIKIKSDFKVPDKRFWWIKIKALTAIKDWESLDKFAKEKKSPIGYVPFVDCCLEVGAEKEAERYISRIPEPDIRVEYYLRVKNIADAVETAKMAKSAELLMLIRSKTQDKQWISQIDQILAQTPSK